MPCWCSFVKVPAFAPQCDSPLERQYSSTALRVWRSAKRRGGLKFEMCLIPSNMCLCGRPRPHVPQRGKKDGVLADSHSRSLLVSTSPWQDKNDENTVTHR